MSREINTTYANTTRLDYGDFQDKVDGNWSFRFGIRFKMHAFVEASNDYRYLFYIATANSSNMLKAYYQETTGLIHCDIASTSIAENKILKQFTSNPTTLSAADNGVWHTLFWSMVFTEGSGQYSCKMYLDTTELINTTGGTGPFDRGIVMPDNSEHLSIGCKRAEIALADASYYVFNGEIADVMLGTGDWDDADERTACATRSFRDVLDADDIIFNPTLRESLDDPIIGITPTTRGTDSVIRKIGPAILHHDQADTVLVIGDTQVHDDAEMVTLGDFIYDYKDALKIKLAGHVGDFIDAAVGVSNTTPQAEGGFVGGWNTHDEKTYTFVNKLEIPVTSVMGNHDYDVVDSKPSNSTIYSANHGLSTEDAVTLSVDGGGTLPTGWSTGVTYYIHVQGIHYFTLHANTSDAANDVNAVLVTDHGTPTRYYTKAPAAAVAFPSTNLKYQISPTGGRSNYIMSGGRGVEKGIPQTWVEGQSWFNGECWATDYHAHWFTVVIDGRDTLIFVTPHCPYLIMLDWIVDTCKEHAGLPVWLFTHSWLAAEDGTHYTSSHAHHNELYFRWQDENGGSTEAGHSNWPINSDRVWDEYYKLIPNLSFIACGHSVTWGAHVPARRREDRGVFGNNVLQLLVNDQGGDNGGNGYMQFLQVRNGEIKVDTYRPLTDLFEADADDEQFTDRTPTFVSPPKRNRERDNRVLNVRGH